MIEKYTDTLLSVRTLFRRLNIILGGASILVLVIAQIPVRAVSAAFVPSGINAASTANFSAIADTYVDSSSANTNYGSLTQIRVDNSPTVRSYLRFDIQGLNGSVTNAMLRIYANSSSTQGYTINSVSDTGWDELTMTYNNAPAIGSVIGNSGGFNSNAWTSVDITSMVTGNGTIGLALVGISDTAVSLVSREGGANAPQLVITTDSSTATSTPAPTINATLTATPTVVSGKTTDITFNPAADAYVDSSSANTNYGGSTELRVDNSPIVRSYLRFNIQGLSGSVLKATLRLYPTNSSSSGYKVYLGPDTGWVETSINYNNAPSLGNLAGSVSSLSSRSWASVDVTQFITGNTVVTIAVTGNNNKSISFVSREGGTNAPQLVITTGSGTVTTPTVGPSATRTPTQVITATSTVIPTKTNTPVSGGDPVLVGAGDIASCSSSGDEATAKLLDNIAGTVFAAGDNAYSSGTLTEYTNCYDPSWGRFKTRTRPAPGNHEYNTSGAAGYYAYFGSAAGDPAKGYYSYNLGSWHIVVLNSEISEGTGSAQEQWLRQDLAANPAACTLAYWHKPMFSSGSTHGGDTGSRALWQALYDNQAEVIVNGHEHNYERFAPQSPAGAADSLGIREFVAGMGGAGHYGFGSAKPNSVVRNGDTFGVLKFTLHANSYDWQFVPEAGKSFSDSGTAQCNP